MITNVTCNTGIKSDSFGQLSNKKVYQVDTDHKEIKLYFKMGLMTETSKPFQISWEQLVEEGMDSALKYLIKQKKIHASFAAVKLANKDDKETTIKAIEAKYDKQIANILGTDEEVDSEGYESPLDGPKIINVESNQKEIEEELKLLKASSKAKTKAKNKSKSKTK